MEIINLNSVIKTGISSLSDITTTLDKSSNVITGYNFISKIKLTERNNSLINFEIAKVSRLYLEKEE